MTVTMIDCIASNLSFVRKRFPTSPFAGYVTGGWPIEWSELQFDSITRKIRIAQQPSLLIDEETTARALDVERFAATYADWPAFYESRASKPRATCYCSLDNVPNVIAACKDASVPLPPRWWLAWYWQRPGQPSLSQVLAELHALTGVTLDPATVWATQYGNFGLWDESVVYGIPDFSRV